MSYPKRKTSQKNVMFSSNFFVTLTRNDLRNLRIHSSNTTGDLKHERTNHDCLSPFLNTPITVLYPVCLNCSPYTSHHTLKESITIFWCALNITFHLSNHCIAWIILAFVNLQIRLICQKTNIYDCGWYLKRKNQIVDKLNVDWPESKFDFIIIPCWTSVSHRHKFLSLTNKPCCLFSFLHPPYISVFATVSEPVFQTKNGFLYKSTVRDQIYLEPENCCYQCWYTHARRLQKKRRQIILLFTKNRLLNITLGHQKQLLCDSAAPGIRLKLFV